MVPSGIISKDIFSVMIVMVLFTTLVTPIMLKLAFRSKDAEPEKPDKPATSDG